MIVHVRLVRIVLLARKNVDAYHRGVHRVPWVRPCKFRLIDVGRVRRYSIYWSRTHTCVLRSMIGMLFGRNPPKCGNTMYDDEHWTFHACPRFTALFAQMVWLLLASFAVELGNFKAVRGGSRGSSQVYLHTITGKTSEIAFEQQAFHGLSLGCFVIFCRQ